jgi:hypothetical protein
MAKTKRFFAERILMELQNDNRNIDFKINERQVFVVLDETVNELAAASYFENWKLSGAGIDEGFITTFEPVTVIDQANGNLSYFDFPCNYAALPMNRGIDEIYPLKYNTTHQSAVVVLSHSDYRLYQNNPARGFEGRLYGYPKGMRFYFGTCEVTKKYGASFGVRLVVKDSSQIGNDEWYPIPSNVEKLVIDTCIEKLLKRRMAPIDRVRDNVDQP